jgi:hypothetical protein
VVVVLYFRDNNAYDHLCDADTIEEGMGLFDDDTRSDSNEADKKEKIFAVKIDVMNRHGVLYANVVINLGSAIFIYCWYNHQTEL